MTAGAARVVRNAPGARGTRLPKFSADGAAAALASWFPTDTAAATGRPR